MLLKHPSPEILDPASYCPILNLSFLGKITESVAEQLQSFLEDTEALDPFPSRFCPDRGMELALLTNALHRELHPSRLVLLILLDLTVAFDTVSWDLLIHHLANIALK